jgi:hypothetical protein
MMKHKAKRIQPGRNKQYNLSMAAGEHLLPAPSIHLAGKAGS